ncbi:hypothetical protein AGMMS50239_12450 [Bacteroidia bacterium]|nr:hypothetical protein AGMMS50239_12450 [Bacteroidia bacterium]
MWKMQNHITSFFFALLLLLIGCVGSIINDVRDTSIPDMTVKIDSCITIKVENFDGSKPYNVENVIDSVSFIKLTTEDEAIIRRI